MDFAIKKVDDLHFVGRVMAFNLSICLYIYIYVILETGNQNMSMFASGWIKPRFKAILVREMMIDQWMEWGTWCFWRDKELAHHLVDIYY